MPKSGINIDSESDRMTLVTLKKPSTSSCSGEYSCKTDVDSDLNNFCVEVKGEMLGFFLGNVFMTSKI